MIYLDEKEIKQLLLEIETACELVESKETNFEQLGRLFYEYLAEPITHALASKLSEEE